MTNASIVACLIVASALLPQPTGAQEPRRAISGLITAPDGTPIGGALVVGSGAGFEGWAISNEDGSFRLPAAGKFISVRHMDYKPVLVRAALLTEHLVVQLAPADESLWRLKSCASLPDKSRGWIGGLLRVNAGRNHRGPVQGEHDSHWFALLGSERLHVVEGYAWHAGLPVEKKLAALESISVQGWVFGDIVGLDLSGRTHEGNYWRWVGAPIAAAIEYETANRDAAGYFDQVIASACFQSAERR